MSGILYPTLILTLFLIVQILTMMASRKAVLDKNKQQLLDSVNASNKVYNNEELSILVSELMEKQNNILKEAYPVGSIYISYSSTNPASLFGGTWVAFATGRTIVGIDPNSVEFYPVGSVGGEKVHLLTASESGLREHTHQLRMSSTANVGSTGDAPVRGLSSSADANFRTGLTTDITNQNDYYYGSSFIGGTNKSNALNAHNNLQPYITVYMWRRTS